MHTQQYLIQTGIDGFIRLIRARNRISLGEAARELGLPGNIVNNWAYFLEELGIVRISYGLKDIVVEVNKPGNTELLKEEDRMISNVNQMRIHHANLQDSRAEAKKELDQSRKAGIRAHSLDIYPNVPVAQFKIESFMGKIKFDKKTMKQLKRYSVLQNKHLKSIDIQLKKNAMAQKKLRDYVKSRNNRLAMKNIFLERRMKLIKKTINALNSKILKSSLKD